MKKQDEYYYDALGLLDCGKAGAKKAIKLLETALKVDEDV